MEPQNNRSSIMQSMAPREATPPKKQGGVVIAQQFTRIRETIDGRTGQVIRQIVQKPPEPKQK